VGAPGDGRGGGYLEVDAAALLRLGLGLLRRLRGAALRSPHDARAFHALGPIARGRRRLGEKEAAAAVAEGAPSIF
jgi:hypothetical protein